MARPRAISPQLQRSRTRVSAERFHTVCLALGMCSELQRSRTRVSAERTSLLQQIARNTDFNGAALV